MSTLLDNPMSETAGEKLKPYVPRLLIEWMRDTPEAQYKAIDGSLVFVDISGFTALTERLARRGKVGAEIMRDTLDGVFTALLDEAYDWGAGLLKWGGDALLLLFDGPLHAERAARACWEMQKTLDRVGRLRVGGGTIVLRMSIGITTGKLEFFLAGSVHRELLIAGPGATETVTIEAIADAGEIGLSAALAAVLDPRCVGPANEQARLLIAPPDVERNRAPDVGSVRHLDIASCIPIAARSHVLLDRSEPEHRTITAAFIDLMDTDDLLARLGPDALAEGLHERLSAIQEAALKYEVPFYETDVGKGSVKALLTAGAPSSTGHDEERILRALREIMDRPGIVPMRIGVNTGKVFTGDFGPPYRRAYRVFGDAINTAARVMSKAEPGQILATEIVLERSRTTFETTPIEPFAAKGKSQPVRASIVGAVRGQRASVVREAPLVGRERELETLLRLVEDARQSRGWIVDVSGGPGLGKTRLVEDVISRAADVFVFRTRCEEYESSTPYFPFRAPFRTLLGLSTDDDPDAERLRSAAEQVDPALVPWVPLLGVLLGADLPHTPQTKALDDRFIPERVAETMIRFIYTSLAGTTTVLVVEDAQYMDESSRELLRRLAQAGTERKQVLFVTHDGTGSLFDPGGADDLPALSLSLVPLSFSAAVAMIDAATEDNPLPPHSVEEIARRSSGSPLFLFELLDLVRKTGSVDALPDSVEAAVAADIDRLSPADRAVLRYAAVLGTSFDPSLLAVALEGEVALDEDVWERLADLVEQTGAEELRFRNTLIRDAAYEGLPFRRRRVLHGRVGEAIEASAGAEEVGALALHFYEGQQWVRAWEYSRRAGDRAMEIYSNVEAARFYERAVQAGRRLRRVHDAEIAAVVEALGEARYRLGDFAGAAVAYRKARRTFGSASNEASRLIAKESKLHERVGRYPAALRLLRRGLNALEGNPTRAGAADRAELCGWYAGVRFRQGRYRDAIEWCLRAEREARAGRSREALAHAYLVHDVALLMLGDTSMPHFRESLKIYEELGNIREQGTLLTNMGFVAYEESRWDDSLELHRRSRTMLETIGDRWNAALATYNIAEILSDQGRYLEAEPLLREVLRVWRASSSRSEVADATRQLGRLMARRGDFDEARALFVTARGQQLEGGELSEVVATDARVAECLLFSGNTEAALAVATDAEARAHATEGADRVLPLLEGVRGWALLQAGLPDQAEPVLEHASALARDRGTKLEVAFALEGLGELRRRQGLDAGDIENERSELLEGLGVVLTPAVPLTPAHEAVPAGPA